MQPLTRIADDTVAALPDATDPLALSLNENPFSPLPAVRSALIAAIDSANRYPEFLPERLRRLIASGIGLAEEQVVLGQGATGVAMQLLHAMTEPGDRIAMTTPTFDGYPIFAQMARLQPIMVPLDEYGHHDLDALAEAAADARVVILCRPHNPTGTLESAAAVERFLAAVPSDTIVLLDEAYIEFVAPAFRLDGLSLIQRYPNLLVLRTFSKAYGLAGLRIGYGFGSAELTERLWRMQLPFGTDNTSLVAVAASYDAEHQLQRRIRVIAAERRYLRMRLRAMGVYVTEGHANFVYLPPAGKPWQEVFDPAGLRVRHYGDGGVRITVGERWSTRAVLAAVADRR
ncbi:pyridoxal phosphate-dependent aminotransferase [Mycolicibacterium sphagni]|uniref:Aminotransferase class I/II-fold pyridoxal phosphate-dependent enzyme n=1 Tax=Mycolicibacterium sphagni TaxID=1786 RepID=A0ABX2JL66_9MYCO|nr:aminotransferase class I/II-fold pyridoxal phosphate-dependent enzyme [Mycolicibacterium sphagni]NTY58419.1 aminotransferase class I/II-fold pyridoxal phosphate-dependent enzyme [Mycolicibacterium sphagni]